MNNSYCNNTTNCISSDINLKMSEVIICSFISVFMLSCILYNCKKFYYNNIDLSESFI